MKEDLSGIKELFYSRYQKIKLELVTATNELELLENKLDKLTYQGCKDVKSIDFSKLTQVQSGEVDIVGFFENYEELLKTVREKKEYVKQIQETVRKMEQDFKEYSNKFNDVEMKVFIEKYIHQKKLSEIYVKKKNNPNEWYSYIQIKRIAKRISKKLKEN